MNWKINTLAAAAVAAWPVAAAAQDDVAARIQALEAQVQALSRELSALKAATADATASAPAAAAAIQPPAAPAPKPSATASIPGGKPTIASSDERFSATLHAVMQLDTAKYFQDDDLPAAVSVRDLDGGANFRRARLGMDGKIFGDFDYGILFDFGGSGSEDSGRIQDMWLQYSGFGPLKLRVGAFAPSLGLADSASTNGALFPERPAAADVARGLAGGDTRVGAAVYAGGERWLASAAVTGATISSLNSGTSSFNAPTFDEQQGFTLRLAGTPLVGEGWLAHLGANASVITQPADLGTAAATRYAVRLRERPELRVDNTRLVDTGAIDAAGARALGLEAAFQARNVMLQGEYFDFRIDRRHPAPGLTDPGFSGWYVEGGWVLTGEARKYNTKTAAFDAPSVARPFDPAAGAWGAWELAARYSTLDLDANADSAVAADRIRGGQQTIWALGVNWFPNPAVKFMLDVQDVSIDRRNAAGAALDQDFRTLNLRSQVAF